jgi:hypothetical protein
VASNLKGYVETPSDVVDLMVDRLFERRLPSESDRLLDPGCATGAFVEGVLRWCKRNHRLAPRIVGVELDSKLAHEAEERFRGLDSVEVVETDFLVFDAKPFDYIIGNPPYVPITELTEKDKARYRGIFYTATGRFDLYLLFFERALHLLKPNGRLIFITPEKFLYVETAAPLRKLLASKRLEEIRLIEEDVFGGLVTYPTITTVTNAPGPVETLVILRDGRTSRVVLAKDGSSWLPSINGKKPRRSRLVLEDLCVRISCGVATGADSIFIKKGDGLTEELREYAYPTIAGRDLTPKIEAPRSSRYILVPYDKKGRLHPLSELGALRSYLSRPEIRERLERRTCVERKPWYAFHETPPLPEILRPKILCKDITSTPRFWIDREGGIVPRHSVYYIVPKDPKHLDKLADYLNSESAKKWLEANCQRAANGFLRLQSRILKRLPVPPGLVAQVSLLGDRVASSSHVRATEASE